MVDEFGVDPLREPVYSLLSGEYATHTVKTTIHVGELKVPQYVVIRPRSLFPIVLSPEDIHSLAHPI